jgi:peptidoglycan/xylan/chitin deacetylase (PgdA/CDA1 family)
LTGIVAVLASSGNLRRKIARLLRRSRAPSTEAQAQRPIILAYHRVADPDIHPWGLAVTPDRFQEHLALVRAMREPFSMSAFLQRLERGNLPANAVAVTFDDGYVDNLTTAKPRLERAGIPACVFVATGYVGGGKEFWWDELARIILDCRVSIDCEIAVGRKRHRLALRMPARDEMRKPWTNWQQPRTERERAYVEVWSLIRDLTPAERNDACRRCARSCKAGHPPPRTWR